MAREHLQLKLRLPEEMKARLYEEALRHGRSLNSEIVARLKLTLAIQSAEDSLDSLPVPASDADVIARLDRAAAGLEIIIKSLQAAREE